MALTRNHWTIGDVTITSVVELEMPVAPEMVLGAATVADVQAHPWLVPTPGHSPGHMSIEIVSRGERAFVTGDIMHHPLQCAIPHLASNFDSDADAAQAMRRTVLAERADSDWLIIGTLFAGVGSGHIHTEGNAWRFEASQSEIAQTDTRTLVP